MSDQSVSEARAQTLTAQRLVNRVVRGLLRTPLINRALGKRLVTVYAIGRKTGRQYAVPVAYLRQGEVLLIGSPFGWIRNLRNGEPVDILLAGKRVTVDVEVVADEAGVIDAYSTMARCNHNFAKFNRIGLDAGGVPVQADVRAAWAAGARAARLTPR